MNYHPSEQQQRLNPAKIRIDANFLLHLIHASFIPLFSDFTSNSAKRLYLVVNQHEANEAEAENGYDTTQIITLPLNLFTLLFGRLAACFRSPVVLLCDIKGCIYFINIKLQEPKLRRPVVLCEANSRIVCISRVELGILPSEGALRNRDAISLLETALGNVKNGESQTHALSLTGLLMVSETGNCLYLPTNINIVFEKVF